MRQFFEGRWLGHPLHPILVELPVALWPLVLILDLLTRLGIGGETLVRAGFVALVVGVLSAVGAATAGIVDWSGIKPSNPAWRIGMYHLLLNVSATVLAAASLVLRLSHLNETETGSVPLLLMLAVTAILSVSAYLGGRMVYDYGVSVARLTRGYWRRRAEASGARVAE